jgi:hypothetical protein
MKSDVGGQIGRSARITRGNCSKLAAIAGAKRTNRGRKSLSANAADCSDGGVDAALSNLGGNDDCFSVWLP